MQVPIRRGTARLDIHRHPDKLKDFEFYSDAPLDSHRYSGRGMRKARLGAFLEKGINIYRRIVML